MQRPTQKVPDRRIRARPAPLRISHFTPQDEAAAQQGTAAAAARSAAAAAGPIPAAGAERQGPERADSAAPGGAFLTRMLADSQDPNADPNVVSVVVGGGGGAGHTVMQVHAVPSDALRANAAAGAGAAMRSGTATAGSSGRVVAAAAAGALARQGTDASDVVVPGEVWGEGSSGRPAEQQAAGGGRQGRRREAWSERDDASSIPSEETVDHDALR